MPRLRLGLIGDFAILALAVLALANPPDRAWADHYATTVYPAIQHAATPLTSAVPFAVGDLLLVPAALLVVWAVRRVARGRGLRGRALALAVAVRRTLAIVAAVLLWFEAAWGLTYDRTPIAAKVDYAPARVTADAGSAFARRVGTALEREVGAAHAHPIENAPMREALVVPFRRVVERLGAPPGFAPAVPKTSVANPYLASTGTTGFTDPFTYEVVLERHLGPYERPFTLAHEWGHLAGFASETEANFIAALTCTASDDPTIRYAGWLGIYFYLPAEEAAAAVHDPRVAADIAEIRAGYARRMNRGVATVAWTAYNGYLKANRVRSGTASYGAFIDLLVGTKLDESGLPKLRE